MRVERTAGWKREKNTDTVTDSRQRQEEEEQGRVWINDRRGQTELEKALSLGFARVIGGEDSLQTASSLLMSRDVLR